MPPLAKISNYFKFTAKYNIDDAPKHERFEFFNGESPYAAAMAFDRAMKNLEKFHGTVSVWRMPDFEGRWNDYKVKEIGR